MALRADNLERKPGQNRVRSTAAETARPIVKWAGGKRQLLPVIEANMPQRFGRYFEPMAGGAALFFRLGPQDAFLGDVNDELINLYRVVRDEVEGLIKDLRKHVYAEDYFYELRNVDRNGRYKRWGAVRKASRFIYLNRTCFNGLYRVNASGHFNVPFGRYTNPRILDEDNLRACSAALKGCQIELGSFEQIEDTVRKGDFVYFDPPYAPLTATANFTSYTQEGFDVDMQIRLRDYCVKLDRKGVNFLLSNSSAPLVLELYDGFDLQCVNASRAINSNGAKRGKIKEVLVKNY